jgi:hypothetical protein
MTQTIDQTSPQAPAETDLVTAVQQVLQASDEPLTLSKIRSSLPARFRSVSPEELTEVLRRQVAANVLWQYPRYRSQQERFWDRPMAVHITELLRSALREGPLPWSELRRKLPAYAQGQAESVLAEGVAQGVFYRYPRSGRAGERFGLEPPDPKDYLRSELAALFRRLEPLGFSQARLREGALELLHEEEWSLSSAPGEAPPAAEQVQQPPAAPPEPTPAPAAASAPASSTDQAQAPAVQGPSPPSTNTPSTETNLP